MKISPFGVICMRRERLRTVIMILSRRFISLLVLFSAPPPTTCWCLLQLTNSRSAPILSHFTMEQWLALASTWVSPFPLSVYRAISSTGIPFSLASTAPPATGISPFLTVKVRHNRNFPLRAIINANQGCGVNDHTL